jgi:hypothetical protein
MPCSAQRLVVDLLLPCSLHVMLSWAASGLQVHSEDDAASIAWCREGREGGEHEPLRSASHDPSSCCTLLPLVPPFCCYLYCRLYCRIWRAWTRLPWRLRLPRWKQRGPSQARSSRWQRQRHPRWRLGKVGLAGVQHIQAAVGGWRLAGLMGPGERCDLVLITPSRPRLRLPAGSSSPPKPAATVPATAGGTQSLAPNTPDNPKLTQELLQRLEQLESENERMKQCK